MGAVTRVVGERGEGEMQGACSTALPDGGLSQGPRAFPEAELGTGTLVGAVEQRRAQSRDCGEGVHRKGRDEAESLWLMPVPWGRCLAPLSAQGSAHRKQFSGRNYQ